MTRADTQAAAEALVHYILGEFDLAYYETEVIVEDLGDNGRARLSLLDEYDHAVFRFDHERAHDVPTLCRTARHECCHVLHSPLELFHSVWHGMTPGGGQEDRDSPDATADRVFRHCIERFVVRMERAFEKTENLSVRALEGVAESALANIRN